MKNLSKWAEAHPVKARWMIALCRILLLFNGLLLGTLLFLIGVECSRNLLLVIVVFYFSAYLFYPLKGAHKGLFRHSYWRQKAHDFTLVMCSFLAIMWLMNAFLAAPFPNQTSEWQQQQPKAQLVVFKTVPKEDLDQAPMLDRKQLRQELKEYRREMRRHRREGLPTVAKVLLILLSIGAGLLLAYGVGAWSCTLSCNGQEGLATFVLISGSILTIFLTLMAMRAIVRSGKARTKKKAG